MGLKTDRRTQKRLFLIGAWLALTVSLAGWWLVHGLQQNVSSQRMLYWEGASLILLLFAGGAALLYYNLRESRRHQQVQEFFATLTHELKTPLASLRLQVESLQEDLSNTEHAKLIERLVQDTARLELQLENALFLASVKSAEQLHLENLSVKEVLTSLQPQWPELQVAVKEDCLVKADVRALEGVLKNLIQNARVHGKATQINVHAENQSNRVRLSVEDNGQGFKGDPSRLGKLFVRHSSLSGSGVGLYLSKHLVEKMNGRLEFQNQNPRGFVAYVTLDGGAA